MTAPFEQLFTPYRLGTVEVRSRIASAPHNLRAHGLPVHVTGDALAPRSLRDAVLEGTRAARAICPRRRPA